LNSIQKDKILRLDGWKMEFFLVFYDFIERRLAKSGGEVDVHEEGFGSIPF
jgi:hypothetical protein